MQRLVGGIIVTQGFYPHYAFDPSKSLTGPAIENAWMSFEREQTKQRIWADLSSAYIITRLYYENYHDPNPAPAIGGVTRGMNDGAYIGSIWGSNIQPEAYGTYSGLTLLWESSISDVFIRHISSDVADPHYITFVNSVPFRYYIIDLVNNYSGNVGIGFRRLEWQEDV